MRQQRRFSGVKHQSAVPDRGAQTLRLRDGRWIILALALATACKPPSPSEQMDSIQSWLATAVMASEAWLRHTTRDAYTKQTLNLAHDTLLQIGDELLKSPPGNLDSAGFDSALTRSRGRVAQMARLVEAKDAPDFRIQLDSLRVDAKTVKRFGDSIEKGQ